MKYRKMIIEIFKQTSVNRKYIFIRLGFTGEISSRIVTRIKVELRKTFPSVYNTRFLSNQSKVDQYSFEVTSK